MTLFSYRGAAVCALLQIALAGAGCAPDEEAADVPAEPEAIVLRWPSIAEAERYELRVWAGERLLFEESVSDTALTLPESLRRTVAAFDTVEVVVRGTQRGERMVAEPIRWKRPLAD